MKIATFNLCEEKKENFGLYTFLKKFKGVDVIFLQEMYLPLKILNSIFLSFPYFHKEKCNSSSPPNEIKCYSNLILSKRKIYSSHLGVYVINLKKRVYLFNIHFNDSPYQPYQLSLKDYGDGFFLTGKDEYSLFEYSKIARGKAIEKTIASIKKIKSKVILGGDFNEPDGYYCSTLIKENKGKLILPPSFTYIESEDTIDLFYIFNFKKIKNKGIFLSSPDESDHHSFWIEV